jgi:hypothetical protein
MAVHKMTHSGQNEWEGGYDGPLSQQNMNNEESGGVQRGLLVHSRRCTHLSRLIEFWLGPQLSGCCLRGCNQTSMSFLSATGTFSQPCW